MKKFFVLVVLFSTVLSAAPQDARQSFKLGAGFSGHSNGAGFDLDLAFPSLLQFKTNEGRTRVDMHLYVEGGDEWVSNLVQSAGSSLTVHNVLLGAGIRMQTSLAEGSGILSPYSVLGTEAVIVSPKLSANRGSFGFRVGLGADLVFVRAVNTLLGISDSAFFVEGNLVFFHRKATAIAGEPVFRDGFIPRIGFRSHF